MMKRIVFGLLGFLALGGVAFATGGFYFPGSEGTVTPAPATAYLTCYNLDSGFQLASANTSRPDILATFVQRVNGVDTKVCFLRPPVAVGDWNAQVPAVSTPSVPSTPPPTPQPKQGWVWFNGSTTLVQNIYTGQVLDINHPDYK
jgi:hypothetical protein